MVDPNSVAVFRDLATAAGILFGAGCVAWNWEIKERLNRRRETPSLDGQLKVSAAPMGGERSLVTLEATWKNLGSKPVQVDWQRTCVEVYEVTLESNFGRITTYDEGAVLQDRVMPFEDTPEYMIKPQSEACIPEHFSLKRGGTYLFKWIIYVGKGQTPDQDYFVRELVCGMKAKHKVLQRMSQMSQSTVSCLPNRRNRRLDSTSYSSEYSVSENFR